MTRFGEKESARGGTFHHISTFFGINFQNSKNEAFIRFFEYFWIISKLRIPKMFNLHLYQLSIHNKNTRKASWISLSPIYISYLKSFQLHHVPQKTIPICLIFSNIFLRQNNRKIYILRLNISHSVSNTYAFNK